MNNCFFFSKKYGPKIHEKIVVPRSKPIVKFIVSVGRRAIAIGIPRNDVFPIKPPNCSEGFGRNFFMEGIIFMKIIRNKIVIKARNAELIKSIFIPALSNKPITLIGIPYLIKLIDIFSDNLGLIFPRKKPINKKGTISINNLLMI